MISLEFIFAIGLNEELIILNKESCFMSSFSVLVNEYVSRYLLYLQKVNEYVSRYLLYLQNVNEYVSRYLLYLQKVNEYVSRYLLYLQKVICIV